MIDKKNEEINREYKFAKQWFDQNGKLNYVTINRKENNYTKVIFSYNDNEEEECHEDANIATIKLYYKIEKKIKK